MSSRADLRAEIIELLQMASELSEVTEGPVVGYLVDMALEQMSLYQESVKRDKLNS